MTPISASLTNFTAFLPQSCYYSCYVSRRILTTLLVQLQKHTDIGAHDFAYSPGISLDFLTLPASEAGAFVELVLLCVKVGPCRFLNCHIHHPNVSFKAR
jgi:hypothetical protein